MYPNMGMPPPPWWGYPPIPQTAAAPDLNSIRQYIKDLKEWEKEIKGKDEKKPESKVPNVSIFSMMLLMLLVSPVTGPTMYHFFQLSLGIIK